MCAQRQLDAARGTLASVGSDIGTVRVARRVGEVERILLDSAGARLSVAGAILDPRVEGDVCRIGGHGVSEYQYYEFVAVDRPLSGREQEQVRAVSTRARITATSFVNEYHWGDLRGDPRRMVERYYDAHLYVANWGTRRFMIRLPRIVMDLDVAEQYCVGESVEAWASGDYLVLDFTSEDEAGDFDIDPDVLLSGLVGVRGEIVAGDLRPLYLAWLAGCAIWDCEEPAVGDNQDEFEPPPVPAGLQSLTGPQRALADFLRLDADLLQSAAAASPELVPAREDGDALAGWIADLTVAEKNRMLLGVAEDNAVMVRAELLRGFREHSTPRSEEGCPPPTVAELLTAAARDRAARESHRRIALAEVQARRERDRAAEQERRLGRLASAGDSAWDRVEAAIVSRKPAEYDAAVDLLTDLHTLAERDGGMAPFEQRIADLRQRHARKASFIDRLDTAGIDSGAGVSIRRSRGNPDWAKRPILAAPSLPR